MDIKLISLNNFSGYHAPVKTLFLRGKFGDKVTKGFYGETITKRNVCLDHLDAHSKGGRSNWGNLVLASKFKNHKKGARPLHEFIDIEAAKAYLKTAKPGYFKPENYQIKASKDGYATQYTPIDSHISNWYWFGNLVFGGLIGWFIVDPLTGDMYYLDEVATVNMTPLS